MIHRISTSALALAALIAAPALHAATPDTVASAPAPAATASLFSTAPAITDPTREFRYQPEGVSSSDDAIAAAAPAPSVSENFDPAGQPPPGRRRSYGRSRYQDRLHNADGSSKIAFMAGAGLNMPVGNTGRYYTPSYTFGAGAGWNFNRTFGILGEFHYDHMGVTSNAINYEYNNLINYGFLPSDLAGFDANAHVLSITANPIVNFSDPRSRIGAYVTGGFGFYKKTTNFTLPSVGTSCSFYCVQYYTTYNIDSASSNSLGFNGGFGLTYKLSEFSSERLFVDARYNWVKISSNNNDFFPFNSRNTGYIPITVGIRF